MLFIKKKRVFTKKMINSFKTIAKVEDDLLLKYIAAMLQEKYKYSIELTEEYLIAKGNIPICLVAHVDTVFYGTPVDIYHDKEHDVLWSPQGLGADDRAGICAIVEILKAVTDDRLPHIILTTGEERGGMGAYALIDKHKKAPFDIKFFIELDRQGDNDCVFYNCDNKDFIKTIEKYGFKEAEGTFTDISIIAPEWGAAAVNLSVGYYQEHTNAEYLKIKELNSTIYRVVAILCDNDKLPAFKYIPKKDTFSFFFNNNKKIKNKKYTSCVWCESTIKKKDAYLDPYIGYLCNKCQRNIFY